MQTEHRYDVAFSFAGEDRAYVEKVAAELQQLGIRVFYDRSEQVVLWGKDLYTHLRNVYQRDARYTVMFISKHYADKLWTNHERESAQARAFEESSEYILPVRFDDTEIPGVLPTTGYLDLRSISPSDLANAIREKLGIVGSSLQETDTGAAAEPYITPSGGPVIVWRMPRGFLLLEDILAEPHDSWAITIEHYGYDGFDHYGTHYHESYRRYWEEVGGIETQCRKLDIPFADWRFASGALRLAMDIRHGDVVVDEQGNVTRNGRPSRLHDGVARVFPSGNVPPQTPPYEYSGLQITGAVRDIIAEAEDLTAPAWRRDNPPPEDLPGTAKALRRLTRVEINKLLPPDHPARINVEEIIDDFSRDWTKDKVEEWLRELAQSLREASAEIRAKYEPAGGV